MRPHVYYLRETMVPPETVRGRRVLDFSAGLGDLSAYMASAGAQSITATRPEGDVPDDDPPINWVGDVTASNIRQRLSGAEFDLATARMVFQFPIWEDHGADPDTMASQMRDLLVVGGHLVIAVHEFVPDRVVAEGGMRRIVDYLGLPPREGPLGETGYGLKVPMLVTSLVRSGFAVEHADHPEPFTFPVDTAGMTRAQLVARGDRILEVKRRHLVDRRGSDYERPGVVREMLEELADLMTFVAWPIVRVVATAV